MAHYQKIPNGHYRFHVTACNSDGIWNLTGASFDFTLKPRFYETLIFQLTVLLAVGLFLFAAYWSLKKYFSFQKIKNKYKHSSLDTAITGKTIKKLLFLLKEEKIYKESGISLEALAQKLSLQPRVLSQVINEHLNKNFWGLINSYRMEEALRLLKDPGEKQTSILDIAFEVGFNSKEAFNRVFKKHTGMTPSQYRKETRLKK